MAGILFIVTAFVFGYALLNLFYKRENLKTFYTLGNEALKFPLWFFELASSFIIGTAFLTIITYYLAYMSKTSGDPLFYGNFFSILIALVASATIYKKMNLLKNFRWPDWEEISSYKTEIFLFLVSLVLFSVFMIYSFYIKDGNMAVGFSVHGDFGPHIAMIRSFSWGDNFPTQYPHYPDGTVRYHFMFQFLTGNLEYLGMRIDTAFNTISIFAITAQTMLVYLLALVISGNKLAGIFSCVFFFFRSGFGMFYYLGDLAAKNLPSLKVWKDTLLNNKTYVGKTIHEEWGLYTQNVYANQRHLAFGIASMLIMLIIFYPLFQKMVATLRAQNYNFFKGIFKNLYKRTPKNILRETLLPLFGKADDWLFEDPKRAIFTGVFIGVCGFFNGAVLISGMLVMFFMALFSKHRLEYLATATIAMVLFYAQVKFFTGSQTKAEANIFIGYLANMPPEVTNKMDQLFNKEHKYWEGLWEAFNAIPYIIIFYLKVLGIFPLMLIGSILVLPKKSWGLILAFLSPLIFASTMKLTPDINVNHKYIMISVFLLNIFVAIFVSKIFENKKLITLGIFLVFMLTVTGLYDFITYFNINDDRVQYPVENPIVKWINDKTPKNSVFLTHFGPLNNPLIAGRPIFYGWPYYAWSAGYPAEKREVVFKAICAEGDGETLVKMLKDNNISYVYMDNELSENKDYKFNKEVFLNKLKVVYENKQDRVKILKVE